MISTTLDEEIAECQEQLAHWSQRLRDLTRRRALVRIRDDWRVLATLPLDLRGDRSVVVEALAQHGGALQYASDELRADPDIVLAAIRPGGTALELMHAHQGLRANRSFMLRAVSRAGRSLRSAAAVLRSDRVLVVAAVAQDGAALSYASDELKADREVVLAALASSGTALRYAGAELRGDLEVVLAAVAQSGSALSYAQPPWNSWPSLGLRVQAELRAAAAFRIWLCAATCLPSAEGSGDCPAGVAVLGSLDPETAEALRRLVAAFLAPPSGRFLRFVQGAAVWRIGDPSLHS